VPEGQESIIYLSQEAYDKLADELAYLKGDGRANIAAKIGRARDEGDLSENAGYHAAREEQGQMEARIKQLAHLIENAQVGEVLADSKEVRPGLKVHVYYDGDREDDDVFILGSREMMQFDDSVDIDVYSPQSPLGSAVMGAEVGQTVSYRAPNGGSVSVTIVSLEN
jgi:transcription elongation factor GreA